MVAAAGWKLPMWPGACYLGERYPREKALPPKKGTKAYDAETTFVYFGIHSDRLTVEEVWQQRDGVLNGDRGNHYVSAGRQAESEIALVFHLNDIRRVPISLYETAGPGIRSKLEEIAAHRKRDKFESGSPHESTD